MLTETPPTQPNSAADSSPSKVQPANAYSAILPEVRRIVNCLCSRQNTSIAIMSQFPHDGRSLVTGILAETAAYFSNKNVLVISACDNSALVSKHEIQRFSNDQPGRTITTAHIRVLFGPAEPSALHTFTESHDSESLIIPEHAFGDYLEAVRPQHDLILIDCCSLSSISTRDPHPAIINSLVDSTLLVLSQQSLSRSALLSLKEMMRLYSIRPIGLLYTAGSLA